MSVEIEKITELAEVPEGENIFALGGFPARDGTEAYCSLMLMYDEKGGRQPIPSILPEAWKGKFTPHFSKCEAEFYEEYGITHIVLLQCPAEVAAAYDEHRKVYFSRGVEIEGPFVIVSYDQTTKAYKFLHCRDCAVAIADWFARSQDKWKAINEAGKSLYGPTKGETCH